MLDSIINSLKQFPQIHFLWKVDKDTIKNISKLPNVHAFEWLQQPAILAHPNLHAFITHCGQNSITESAIAGIPIIGIPLFADQFYNADIAQKRGLGIQIDVNDLSGPNAENILVEAIRSILYQPKYQQNAKIISKKLKLTPFSPTERLVKWVEFAAEFGDLPELNLPGEKEMNCWSHGQFLGRIADTLVDAGHEVHFLKYIMSPDLQLKNETRKVEKIYHIAPSLANAKQVDVKNMHLIADSFSQRRPFLTFFDHPIIEFDPIMATVCKAEMYDYCPSALFHKLGVRTKIKATAIRLIQMVSRKFDIPSFASFMPSQDKIIREEFGQDFPNLKELVKDTSLMFINSNPFLELTRPISNKVVYIGGLVDDMASEESKKLDEAINFYEAKEGAVLFSFGSLTDTTKLNERMLKSIMGAFRRFSNIHFIWKVDNGTVNNNLKMFESAENVHNFEWFRQPAILEHPNTRAFITHCGQNSLTESARAGVPIIGIPLFGDQFYNCIVGETRGLGVQVDISHLKGGNGENVLVEALEKVTLEN
uniref:glucuronosyltransferase n=1 Tax=Meloidogyne javanica TaxID=6303 RepID=A0A915N2Z5_MELJA